LYHVWIYIVSDVVQEGAVWPLPPVYDIIQSDGLQEIGQTTAYGYNIVSDMVQEGAVWRLHLVYDIIWSGELLHCGTHI
jgi:serine/threonine protein kinase HipA of HipAB toxin-antitoxin module